MGTRSLTTVYDAEQTPLVTLYRQYDGYPRGHGQELADFLRPVTLVNGMTDTTPPRAANGMGCLAAQLVAHFKREIGHFYLYPPGTTDAGQDYDYHIRPRDHGTLDLVVYCGMDRIWQGPVADYDATQIGE